MAKPSPELLQILSLLKDEGWNVGSMKAEDVRELLKKQFSITYSKRPTVSKMLKDLQLAMSGGTLFDTGPAPPGAPYRVDPLQVEIEDLNNIGVPGDKSRTVHVGRGGSVPPSKAIVPYAGSQIVPTGQGSSRYTEPGFRRPPPRPAASAGPTRPHSKGMVLKGVRPGKELALRTPAAAATKTVGRIPGWLKGVGKGGLAGLAVFAGLQALRSLGEETDLLQSADDLAFDQMWQQGLRQNMSQAFEDDLLQQDADYLDKTATVSELRDELMGLLQGRIPVVFDSQSKVTPQIDYAQMLKDHGFTI